MVPKEKIRIFLADDDADDTSLFADALEHIDLNYSLQTFSDGKKLLDHLNSDGVQLPHIIFLDLNMPFFNGLESLKTIRNSEKLKDLSIAIYSTSSLPKDQEETFVAGANIYIRKPNDFSELKKILKMVLIINWQYYSSKLNRDAYFVAL